MLHLFTHDVIRSSRLNFFFPHRQQNPVLSAASTITTMTMRTTMARLSRCLLLLSALSPYVGAFSSQLPSASNPSKVLVTGAGEKRRAERRRLQNVRFPFPVSVCSLHPVDNHDDGDGDDDDGKDGVHRETQQENRSIAFLFNLNNNTNTIMMLATITITINATICVVCPILPMTHAP